MLCVDDNHCRCLCGRASCDWIRPLPQDTALASDADERAPVLPDRDALAATLTPVSGPAAAAISHAIRAAEVRAAALTSLQLVDRGFDAIEDAIAVYRSGGQITSADTSAWLAVPLTALPVRDLAWRRLWTPRMPRPISGCGLT